MSISKVVCDCLAKFKALEITEGSNIGVLDEHGRFRTWAGNIAAHRAGRRSLEYRLRDSSNLQSTVIALLEDLQNALDQYERLSPTNDGRVDDHNLSRARETAKVGQFDDSSPDDDDDEDLFELEDHLTSKSEAYRVLEEVHEVITCLLRFSMTLRNPARHDQMKRAAAISTKHFEPYDIAHVQQKFPNADGYLHERLGKSVSRHRQYFRYREEHHLKLKEGIDDNDAEERPSTIATSLNKGDGAATVSAPAEFETASLYTATSFAPTAAGDADVQPPPLPNAARNGEPFECPMCYVFIVAEDERSWRQHIYEDLPPYVCTYADCITADHRYSRRRDWHRHQVKDHNRCWMCPYGCQLQLDSEEKFSQHLANQHAQVIENSSMKQLSEACAVPCDRRPNLVCPLCQKLHPSSKLWTKHVGHHLEQLALHALPQHFFTSQSDDEADPAEQSVQSSHSSIAGIGVEDRITEAYDDSQSAEQQSVDEHQQVTNPSTTKSRSAQSLQSMQGDSHVDDEPIATRRKRFPSPVEEAPADSFNDEKLSARSSDTREERFPESLISDKEAGWPEGTSVDDRAKQTFAEEYTSSTPQQTRFFCTLCNEEPNGFFPKDALGRHFERAHAYFEDGVDMLGDEESQPAHLYADRVRKGPQEDPSSSEGRAGNWQALPPYREQTQLSKPSTIARQWFISAEGIDRHVISRDIQRYLGNDATVRSGPGTGANEGVQGYWIKAYRNLTSAMIAELWADSARWRQEQRVTGINEGYAESRTHETSRAAMKEPQQSWGSQSRAASSEGGPPPGFGSGAPPGYVRQGDYYVPMVSAPYGQPSVMAPSRPEPPGHPSVEPHPQNDGAPPGYVRQGDYYVPISSAHYDQPSLIATSRPEQLGYPPAGPYGQPPIPQGRDPRDSRNPRYGGQPEGYDPRYAWPSDSGDPRDPRYGRATHYEDSAWVSQDQPRFSNKPYGLAGLQPYPTPVPSYSQEYSNPGEPYPTFPSIYPGSPGDLNTSRPADASMADPTARTFGGTTSEAHRIAAKSSRAGDADTRYSSPAYPDS